MEEMEKRSDRHIRDLVAHTAFKGLVLLSQKVAADGEENHLFGKIHTSAMGRLEWVCRDQTMVKRDFRPMLRG